jgi:uncharacterized protein (TIGR02996 family)
MAVHFVLRSHYEGPSERFHARFDDATVLDWFRARWGELAARGYASDEVLGTRVYGFGSLGDAIASHGLAPPATPDELAGILDSHLYVEGKLVCKPHCIQVLTDDDEIQLAYFFFDDVWLEANPDRAAFLLHDGWRLPTAAEAQGAPPFSTKIKGKVLARAGEGEGLVWLCLLAFLDSDNLSELPGPLVIEGVRLEELPRWLASLPLTGKGWPRELLLLRAHLLGVPDGLEEREREMLAAIDAAPGEAGPWSVYSDWLLERGRLPAHATVLERALEACGRDRTGQEIAGGLRDGRLEGDLAAARVVLAELVDEREPDEAPPERIPSLVSVGSNVAQLCLYIGTWSRPMYHQWILFDDVWARAHPALADGVLRFARRWNVLS